MTTKNNFISNTHTLQELGHRVERLRIQRNLTQATLANEAGISKRTLERLEHGGTVQITSFLSVLRVLGLLDDFINLIPNAVDSPMAELRNREKVRQRASKRSSSNKSKERNEDWSWGDDS